jgi:hypothetical protein
MEIPDDEYLAATRRADERRRKGPVATAVHYDEQAERIVIDLGSGLSISFHPQDAQGLEQARPEQLADSEISPSGLGIHFPQLDADLYLPALLEGFFGTRRWMAAEMGKTGGKAASEAKTAAARANGKLGGRPKKVKEPLAA